MPLPDPVRPEARHPWAVHLEAFRPRALAWLASRGFDGASAEDVWQQIATRFLTTEARPDPSGSPRAYLWTSLRHDAARARSGWTPVIGERGLLGEVDPAPSPVDAASGEEERAAVRAAVAQLPPVFRSVVERRFLDGQSVSQVADELAIPGTTVATRTFRGLALLKPRLARYRAALAGFLLPRVPRLAVASLIAAMLIGPAAEVAVTEPHELLPVERDDDQPDWLRDAPTSGFPYADQFVIQPMPEA